MTGDFWLSMSGRIHQDGRILVEGDLTGDCRFAPFTGTIRLTGGNEKPRPSVNDGGAETSLVRPEGLKPPAF
jgi:hypothetical protein